jgi:hypothetical protein
MDYETFDCACSVNADGIGIMSEWGIEKFFGPGSADDAWWYLEELQEGRIPHGVHFRFATHGDVSLENCHPFQAPGSDVFVMHNGIIQLTSGPAKFGRSDTALFVDEFMIAAPSPDMPRYAVYLRRISRLIGMMNTLLLFHARTGEFTICNEEVGTWIGDHWYSNTECLPWSLSSDVSSHGLAGIKNNDWLPDELSETPYGQWFEQETGFDEHLQKTPACKSRCRSQGN